MEEKTERSYVVTDCAPSAPIVSEMRRSETAWLSTRRYVLLFSVFSVLNAVLFGLGLNSVLAKSSFINIFFAVGNGIIAVFAASFVAIFAGTLLDILGDDGTLRSELYSDRIVNRFIDKNGCRSVEMFDCRNVVIKRETDKYLFLHGGGSDHIISKKALSAEQTQVVRSLFAQSANADAQALLPKFDAVTKDREQADSATDDRPDARSVKSAFGAFGSRQRAVMLSRIVSGGAVSILSVIGFVLAVGMFYQEGDVRGKLAVFIFAYAFMIAVPWFLGSFASVMDGVRLEKAGVRMDYEFFSDRMIVRTYTDDFVRMREIPYGRVCRVRETKTDIWIDYPSLRATYPLIKSTLAAEELNTVCRLVKCPLPRSAQTDGTVITDSAPTDIFDKFLKCGKADNK